MSSATETAMLGIATVLAALHAASSSVVPAPLRNEDLAARLTDVGSAHVKAYLNLWDGAQTHRDEFLGADNLANAYDIEHEAKIEWVVSGGADADREAAYDAGLIAICDALKADRTLGGAVSFAEIGNLQGPGSGLVTDGIPHAKGVVIPIALSFTSSRPF